MHSPLWIIASCDDEQISPVSNADNPLRRAWGLENKFVVGLRHQQE
jgi:hypothetical protein